MERKKLAILLVAIAVAGACIFFLRPAVEPNLEGFIALTQADPLFYAPFFDEAEFTAALARLKEAEDQMNAAAVRNIEAMPEGSQKEAYRSVVGKVSLFPHEFLSELADIPTATDSLLAAPTGGGARKLLRRYARAAEAYEASAAETLKVFELIEAHTPPGRSHLYFFTTRATSASIVHVDFTLIRENALALKAEVERRERCLSGRGSCVSTMPGSDRTAEIAATLRASPASLGAHAAFIRANLPYSPLAEDVRGPYRISSACFPGEREWMYLIHTQKDGAPLVLPKLATENYYRLVSPEADDRISVAVRDLGLDFYSQTEGTTYECTDLTFYPLLATVDHVAQDATERGTDPETLLDEQAYRLLAENRFTGLAPALVALAEYTDLLGASQRISADFVLSPQFLFSTRSGYSLTYLPFARSVWRIEESPAYLLSEEEQAKIGAPSPFKTIDQLKAEGYSEAELARSHLPQGTFIRSLVQE